MEHYVTLGASAGVALVIFVIFTLIFKWIWNWTMPQVFGVGSVTFWQAIGILVLASILFGGHRVVNSDISNIVAKRVQSLVSTTAPPA